ncbi:hypothetical protein C2I18_23445 [Paenibacillus sp. PK3_47]|uniref:hypothetical protein n=1 Tax=Paenibacillus sp. PK3_47 TaxID=2072642 RepID=UPI00201D661B|nr:hypothetical protein [Paenibacillus sp. PK3_47]UQZ36215.1 hypothetical protein C2I18_23445 [Paenibacillus sp. PK3_47]
MLKFVRKLLLPGIVLLILTACSNTETQTIRHDYTFTGESETWSAEYIQTAWEKYIIPEDEDKRVEYETSKKYNFELRYKGEQSDLEDIKQLHYKYEGRGGSGSMNMEGPIPAELLKSGASGTGTMLKEDSIIKVNVDWDGKSEQFELRVKE